MLQARAVVGQVLRLCARRWATEISCPIRDVGPAQVLRCRQKSSLSYGTCASPSVPEDCGHEGRTPQLWTIAHQSRHDLCWLTGWVAGRRTSCVIFARSGGRNVEPCRRAAVLQGKKDAAGLSSVLRAGNGASCWAEQERIWISEMSPATDRSDCQFSRQGTWQGRDEAAFRVQYLLCTAMHSPQFWRV